MHKDIIWEGETPIIYNVIPSLCSKEGFSEVKQVRQGSNEGFLEVKQERQGSNEGFGEIY